MTAIPESESDGRSARTKVRRAENFDQVVEISTAVLCESLCIAGESTKSVNLQAKSSNQLVKADAVSESLDGQKYFWKFLMTPPGTNLKPAQRGQKDRKRHGQSDKFRRV